MLKKSHLPVAILLCGRGGSGKSTLATHLVELLQKDRKCILIRFDEFRKKLTSPGQDPFSPNPQLKFVIYQRAAQEFSQHLNQGHTLVVDSGLSVERIREYLKATLPSLKICHVHCPLPIAIWRDTQRSLLNESHERGKFLHLRAMRDLLNPFRKEKFPQPGITYPFEEPRCADIHINTFFKSPLKAAHEILEKLNL